MTKARGTAMRIGTTNFLARWGIGDASRKGKDLKRVELNLV
jgi:hypothetical protein